MKVLKFGGTSITGIRGIQRVGKIIENKDECAAVVVSAFAGVTDILLEIGHLAREGDESYKPLLEDLKKKHYSVCENLFDELEKKAEKDLEKTFEDVENIINGVCLLREYSKRTSDLLVSYGEKLSAKILVWYLNKQDISAEFLDSGEIIFTDNIYGNANINFDKSEKAIQEKIKQQNGLPIIPGFTGKTSDGQVTTLGRGGSDLSATFIGSCLGVDEIQIWTDVDGFMSADPNKVPDAFSLTSLSYDEALELSYFGAEVLLPPAIQPAREENIPIKIKNTFNKDFPGTIISDETEPLKNFAKGITSIDNISILSISGSGMIGERGISARVFNTLADANINVVLISQASSEQSICVGIPPESAQKAQAELEKEFRSEIQAKRVDSITVEENYSIIAVVGEKMKKTPGVAGRLFSSFGENNINVVAIAQGSSELNISAVICKEDEIRALRAIHEEFFSKKTTVNIILVGTGTIGSELLNQIEENSERLLEEQDLDIRIVGMADINKMLVEPEGIPLSNWKEKLMNSDTASDIPRLIDIISGINLTDCIFVDCTASKAVSDLYEKALEQKMSVVAANKIANTGSYERYANLKQLTADKNVHYLYETNAGAGLPIIDTLNNLKNSGDRIVKIEAILSGTISYIFNEFESGKKFSEIVKKAKKLGYTEPDPRDDLNGKDFARKLLLLSRELGEEMEMEDLKIEELLPERCFEPDSIEGFYEELETLDDKFDQLIKEAESEDKVLRYIATYARGEASIELKKVGSDHPFYSMEGSDNIISIKTSRYKNPLVIKGAGAGAQVTAAGVLADIFRIANSVKKRRSF